MLKYMLDTNIVIYVIKRRPIEALLSNGFGKNLHQIFIYIHFSMQNTNNINVTT